PAPPWSILVPYTTLFRSAFAGHLHADHVGFATGDALLRLGRRDVHAMAVVARGFLIGHLLGAHLIQTLGAAEAREGMAFGDQFRSEEHTSELQSRENLVC